ncbi:MAG: RHS repeat-associated core domain-containing protein [Candidatus Melainabacteria bacterium]|nr:RHS repeat-associated core domain-containing protein [Candidatus Melainabacteria bacterium]
MSKSKWRRFKPMATKRASKADRKTFLFEGKSKSMALIGVFAVFVVGLGITAYATNDLLHGRVSVTERSNQSTPLNVDTQDGDMSKVPKVAGNDPQTVSDLVAKYGAAAASPAVAAAIRKAEGAIGAKEADRQTWMKNQSDAYEALEHGVWKPGADPRMAIMYGYIPPGMSEQLAAMEYSTLPSSLKMPHRLKPGSPEWIAKMSGDAADPTDNLPGLPSRAEIEAVNNTHLEQYMRERFGPGGIVPLHRDQNWLARHAVRTDTGFVAKDHQMSLIEPEYSYDPRGGGPPRIFNPAAGSHSISEMTDQSGNVVSQYRYDPFGRQTKIGGTGPDADFGYQGYYPHPRSGLLFTQTRAYSPALGRFMSRDPIEESGGINLYTYVGNDPINFADPSGLRADSSRSVPCPTHCDNRNGYRICVPYWCLEETRKGRQPGGAGQTFVTVSFTQNGQRYEAQDDLINGGCYWQKAGQ